MNLSLRVFRALVMSALSGLLVLPALAQDTPFHCGANDLSRMSSLIQDDPARYEEIQMAKENLDHFTATWQGNPARDGEPYIIPVVFHIIHENGPENISDAQVYDAVRVMNEDYNKMTPDWQDVRAEFLGIVANVGITFKLAQLDPSGNCTNGITRTQSPLTNDGSQQMKNLINWPRDRYLNIWVAASAGGAAGYSMYPSSVSGSWGAAADGIVVLYNYVGSIGASNLTNSHTLSHEAGHWMNLKHCWGDSNDPGLDSNCGIDDDVSDTPNTKGWTSCNIGGTSCGSLDNVENFMEYSYCSKMFTNGQKARMIAALNSSIAGRNNLWATANLALTGVSLPAQICNVQFQSDMRTVCAGQAVTFTDLSYNGVTTHNWSFTGASPATSTDAVPQVTYDLPGTFPVSLTVGNGSQSMSATQQQYIKVLPSMGSPLPIAEGFESISTLPSNDWSVYDRESNGAFTISTVAAFSGSHSVRLSNSSANPGYRDELISTTVDITTDAPVVLSFRYAYAKRSSTNADALRVYASRDCGATWSLRRALIGDNLVTAPTTSAPFVPNGQGQWGFNQTASIGNLFNVPDLRIKFVFDSDGGNDLWLDDININGASVGVAELNGDAAGAVSVVPNPARDHAVITADLKEAGTVKVDVLDLLGRPVLQVENGAKPAGTAQWTLDLNSLPTGLYLVRLQQSDGVRVVRFTKD